MEYPLPSTSQVRAVIVAGQELDAYRGVERIPVGVIHRFMKSLYDNGFILPNFHWRDEVGRARGFLGRGNLLDELPLLDLVKLLSLHARADRFTESHFEGMVSEGHIQEILHRLEKFL